MKIGCVSARSVARSVYWMLRRLRAELVFQETLQRNFSTRGNAFFGKPSPQLTSVPYTKEQKKEMTTRCGHSRHGRHRGSRPGSSH